MRGAESDAMHQQHLKTSELYGLEPPKAFYSDNALHERGRLLRLYPTLMSGVSPRALPGELPIDEDKLLILTDPFEVDDALEEHVLEPARRAEAIGESFVLGFDCEWNLRDPQATAGAAAAAAGHGKQPVALLQLSTSKREILIRVSRFGTNHLRQRLAS